MAENKANASVEKAVAATAPDSKSFYRFDTAKAVQSTLKEIAKTKQAVKAGGKRGGKGVPSLNLCCADGNRKSLKLSKTLFERLFGTLDEEAKPKELQVLRDGTNLIISENFPDVKESFPFSNPTSMMVYNASLVLWMVEVFGLDFSNGRTSRSFQKIEIVMPEKGSTNKPYAIIDMARPVKK